MTKILEVKELLVGYYKDYEKYINPVVKFVFILVSLLKLNSYLGYNNILGNFFVNVLIAAGATFIPGSWFIVILMGIVGFQLYTAGLIEATIIVILGMIVIYLLFVRLFPKMAYFVVLVPVLFSFHLGYVIPIIAGLFFGPTTIVAIGTGILVYKSVIYLPNLLSMTSESLYDMPDTLVSMYKFILDALMQDRDMILTIVVFSLVVIITYIVSQLEFDYIWYIAIGAGGLTTILGFIIGSVILSVNISVVNVIFGTIIAVIICSIIQFMRFSLDYMRKEQVQFEAIPKIRVTKAEKEIKKIK
jgi:hypothetical protein